MRRIQLPPRRRTRRHAVGAAVLAVRLPGAPRLAAARDADHALVGLEGRAGPARAVHALAALALAAVRRTGGTVVPFLTLRRATFPRRVREASRRARRRRESGLVAKRSRRTRSRQHGAFRAVVAAMARARARGVGESSLVANDVPIGSRGARFRGARRPRTVVTGRAGPALRRVDLRRLHARRRFVRARRAGVPHAEVAAVARLARRFPRSRPLGAARSVVACSCRLRGSHASRTKRPPGEAFRGRNRAFARHGRSAVRGTIVPLGTGRRACRVLEA